MKPSSQRNRGIMEMAKRTTEAGGGTAAHVHKRKRVGKARDKKVTKWVDNGLPSEKTIEILSIIHRHTGEPDGIGTGQLHKEYLQIFERPLNPSVMQQAIWQGTDRGWIDVGWIGYKRALSVTALGLEALERARDYHARMYWLCEQAMGS